ncbi:substrate-binding domain-containing protein [Streptomyces sp. NPDC051940]|uniref:substrate-binding domain-containing protein n=1 Tax=Streptomyces sp. NPDC051940 TaxID=3155675 RepID=UPI003445FA1E
MRLHVNQRHERVLEIVRRRGTLRVAELAEELGVSAVTVRRDVETLAEQGRLTRLHGSVSWPRDAGARATAAPGGGAAGPVLGMIVPSLQHYFAELVHGAQQAVAACGGRLVLGIAHYRPEEDTAQIERMLDARVDGLLLMPSWELGLPSPEQERQLLDMPVPVVLVDRRIPPGGRLAELDSVRSDHVLGAAAAVHHLASLGHTRIALCSQDNPTSPQVREGYHAAMAALGAAEPAGVEIEDLPGPRALDDAAERLRRLVREDGVTAAVLHNDQMAIDVVQRLRELGLDLPRELSLVAYEDEMAALAHVPLTAVAPPRRAVGEAAVSLMRRRLSAAGDGGKAARHVTLVPSVSVRESCLAR